MKITFAKSFSLLLLIVHICFTFIVEAGIPSSFRFEYLTTKQGLSDNYILHLNEDSFGYAWIATRDGLNRYDGYSFVHFRHNKKDTTSLPDNNVWFTYEDSRRNLWVGTDNSGIVIFNRETESFDTFEFKRKRAVPQNGVRTMLQYNDSLYFFGTLHGLCKYNSVTKSQEFIFFDGTDEREIGSNDVMSLFKDAQGRLWVGYEFEQGLCEYDFTTNKLINYKNEPENPSSISGNNIRTIIQINDSTLWIGTYHNGLSEMNLNSRTFSRITFPELHFENDLKGIYNLFHENDSIVWIASSSNDGVIRTNLYTNRSEHFLPDKGSVNGINSASISCVFKDSRENLWFGTHGGGINIINKQKNIFKNYYQTNSKQSLTGKFVSCFLEDSLGNFWVGTDGNGINYFDTRKNEFYHYSLKDGLCSNAVLDMKMTPTSDGFYIATWDGGICYYDGNTKKFVPYEDFITNVGDIKNFNVKGILLDNDTLFIATHFDGLYLLDIKHHRLLTRESVADPALAHYFPNLHSNNVMKDLRGNVWLANYRRLVKIDRQKNTIYLSDDNDSTSISDNYIADIMEDSNGRLWIATAKGLNLYDYEKDEFIQLDELFDLHYNIKSIVEDKNGIIWCGTNQGLLQVNPIDFSSVLFTTEDGLEDNQFFERATLLSSSGQVLIGSLNGFTIFYPDDFNDEAYEPQLMLSGFSIFDIKQSARMHNAPLQTHIQFAEKIELKHNQNFINIDYLAIDLVASSKIRYKYVMEGLEDNWVDAGHERTARYTSIPPGDYIFKVKATNSKGEWCNNEISIAISVIPPWWNTWWFRILVAVVLICFVILIYYIRMRNVKLANAKLKKIVKARTEELSEQNIQLVIKNNEIVAQSDLIHKQKQDVAKKAHELKLQNDRLLAKNEEIKSQRDKISSQKEELDILNKYKDRLFSIIGHDLKNPLNVILGFSDLLIHGGKRITEEKRDHFIYTIRSSSQSMYELLENLLNWARSQSGTHLFAPVKINLLEIANNNISLYSNLSNKKQISLQTGLFEVETAFADYNMVDTIIRNLVNNAIKYTNMNGAIILSSSYINNMVAYSVKDSGVGMSREIAKHLLKGHGAVSTVGTEREKGTGLGFQICVEFANKNNGWLEIISEEGKGTEVILFLPLEKTNDE